MREIGRIERTLIIIDWLLDTDVQRHAQIGLNKREGQHHRMAGLNPLAAIIIYQNTKHLGQAVSARRRTGLDCQRDLLAHISQIGWTHILLTGEHRRRKKFMAG